MGKQQLKEATYDEIYGRREYKDRRGLLAWLYSHLKRYEEAKYQTVFRLLEGSGRKKISSRQDKDNFHFIQHDIDEILPSRKKSE